MDHLQDELYQTLGSDYFPLVMVCSVMGEDVWNVTGEMKGMDYRRTVMN